MSILTDLAREPVGCFESRMDFLRRVRGYNTKIYENGVSDCMARISSGAKSFVVYGEPQSGKTEFMIALSCKLMDEGYETVFVLMNDNTELENQNFNRFLECRQLNPSPMRDFDLNELPNGQLKAGMKRIIFCRKNAKNLDKLLKAVRFMSKRVVIDDEADYASPNANINKKDEKATRINELVEKLISAEKQDGIYIGVTATPARLDLNNTFLNKSTDWVFLESHVKYVGHNFFFPISEADKKNRNYRLVKLSEEGDSPKILEDAIVRFLVRCAFLNLSNGNNEPDAYSMLVHTSGKVNDHVEDKRTIDNFLHHLSNPNSSRIEKLYERIDEEAHRVTSAEAFEIPGREATQFIYNNIQKKDVLVINHKEDSGNVDRACNPRALFTFAIGGNIVSRGLTFNNLLSFFFSRNVKGKLTHNTYIQRARMFGTRSYKKHFELAVPESLFNDWAECFHEHETALSLLRDSGIYLHIQSGRTRATDTRSIDKEHIVSNSGETELGSIFELNSRIDQVLKDKNLQPLDRVEKLLNEGQLLPTNFGKGMINLLRKYSEGEPKLLAMVFKQNGEIQTVDQYKDADVEAIRRARGGMIQATIHKVAEYEQAKYFIMPLRNEAGFARFVYKAFVNKSIMENILK